MDPISNQPVAPKKSYGSAIGIAIVAIVIIIGGLYLWGGKLSGRNDAEAPAVSASDDAESIEADLRATDTSSIDFSELEGLDE